MFRDHRFRLGIAFLLTLGASVTAHGQSYASIAQDIATHERKARQALDEKKPDVAVQEYQAILKLDPNNVDARGNLGVVAYLQGNCPAAVAQFEQALRLQPDLWKVQAMLGLCEKYLGQMNQAKDHLESSFPHLSGSERRLQSRAGLSLAEIYYQQGEPEKALPLLHALEQSDPKNADVFYVEYRIYTDLADQARDKLGLIAPDSARMHQILAQHLINEGDAKRAVEQYREALRLDPRLPGIHFELGEALLQDQSLTQDLARDAAKKEFEIALQQNPNDPKVESRLAAILYLQNDLNGALSHYARAAQLDPNDADAQIGLGRVLMAQDKMDEALEHLKRGVELDPLNAIAHYRLSQAYRRLGQTDAAEQEAKAYKQLKETKEHLRTVYTDIYKQQKPTEALNPDAPK